MKRRLLVSLLFIPVTVFGWLPWTNKNIFEKGPELPQLSEKNRQTCNKLVPFWKSFEKNVPDNNYGLLQHIIKRFSFDKFSPNDYKSVRKHGLLSAQALEDEHDILTMRKILPQFMFTPPSHEYNRVYFNPALDEIEATVPHAKVHMLVDKRKHTSHCAHNRIFNPNYNLEKDGKSLKTPQNQYSEVLFEGKVSPENLIFYYPSKQELERKPIFSDKKLKNGIEEVNQEVVKRIIDPALGKLRQGYEAPLEDDMYPDRAQARYEAQQAAEESLAVRRDAQEKMHAAIQLVTGVNGAFAQAKANAVADMEGYQAAKMEVQLAKKQLIEASLNTLSLQDQTPEVIAQTEELNDQWAELNKERSDLSWKESLSEDADALVQGLRHVAYNLKM